MFREEKHLRIAIMTLGVFLMGVSVSIFSIAKLGTDPYTCFNMGISATLNIPFGVLQLGMNLIIMTIAWFFAKYLIRFGTIVNLVAVGFLVDLFSPLFSSLIPDSLEENIIFRVGLLLFGVVLLSLAASLFFSAKMGVGPYDTIAFIMAAKTKIHFRWCRVIGDIICVSIGLLFGSIVGVGTVVAAFFMGPLVSFFNTKVSQPIFAKYNVEIQE